MLSRFSYHQFLEVIIFYYVVYIVCVDRRSGSIFIHVLNMYFDFVVSELSYFDAFQCLNLPTLSKPPFTHSQSFSSLSKPVTQASLQCLSLSLLSKSPTIV